MFLLEFVDLLEIWSQIFKEDLENLVDQSYSCYLLIPVAPQATRLTTFSKAVPPVKHLLLPDRWRKCR